LRVISGIKKQLFLYGVALALLAFLLNSIHYFYVVRQFSVELYIGLIAVLFTLLGIWVGKKLTTSPNEETGLSFSQNTKALDYLGITDREMEVLELLAEGCSNQQIADRLYISIHTVKSHVSNLLGKLDVDRRTEAVSRGKSLRLIP
jgi:DNA-binding CsgD family transcriptional regulator